MSDSETQRPRSLSTTKMLVAAIAITFDAVVRTGLANVTGEATSNQLCEGFVLIGASTGDVNLRSASQAAISAGLNLLA